ncbi:hypothetical protein GGF37_004465, partial [Kickxella alabastrina]
MQQQMQVQGAGGYGVDSAVVGGLGRDVSTPTSSNSDGLYANVWTVDDAPRVVSAETSFTTTVPARSAGDTLAAAAATATDGKKRRKNRPGVLNITSLGGLPPRMEIVEDSQTGPAEMEVAVEGLPGSPPSPLIHVNRELAKSLGCASSPREPLVTAPPLPPPHHTYHIVDGGVEKAHGGLERSADAESVVDDLSALSTTSADSQVPLPPPPPQPQQEQHLLPPFSLQSPQQPPQTQYTPQTPHTPPTPQPQPSRTSMDVSGLAKTRSLLRDKMSLFNRAKQKARNKLRGFHEPHDDSSVESSPTATTPASIAAADPAVATATTTATAASAPASASASAPAPASASASAPAPGPAPAPTPATNGAAAVAPSRGDPADTMREEVRPKTPDLPANLPLVGQPTVSDLDKPLPALPVVPFSEDTEGSRESILSQDTTN